MEKGFVRKLWKFPTEGQRDLLKTRGLSGNAVYEHGSGDEDIAACIGSFRKRGGTLYIAADMRVLGENQQQIAEAVDRCEREGIAIVDLAHPELGSLAAQIKYAFARLAEWQRWGGDKAKARRTGLRGGKAKALASAARRAEKMPDDAVRRLVGMIGKKLTWRDVEEITGFSTATLRRHYR